MRKLLLAANVLVATLLTGTVARADDPPSGSRNCCEVDVEKNGFCCAHCCWIAGSCSSNKDCKVGGEE